MQTKNWSEKEVNWLIKNYPIHGKYYSCKILKRPEGGVRHKASILRLTVRRDTKHWKENSYLKGNAFRGKKRPEHSTWLTENHPLKGKHHNEQTKKKISRAIKKAFKEGRLSAENFKGHHHSEESKSLIRSSLTGRIRLRKVVNKILRTKMKKYGTLNFNTENTYSRCKRGYYDINGKNMYFRSAWEANYALYLDFLQKQGEIEKWDYEQETFWFEKIRRGVRSYTPDFRVFNKNKEDPEFHEVKGYMDPRSKTKIKRMAKYFPKVTLIVIDKNAYSDIKKKLGGLLKFY